MLHQSQQNTVNVLIATGDASTLEDARQSFPQPDYTVHHAESGPDALAILKQRAVDVMFADSVIPDMPGIHVAGAASRMFPDLPVIMMTESDAPEAVRAALRFGAFEYVTRPLDPRVLRAVVDKTVRTKHADVHRLYEERSKVLFQAIKALAAAIDAKSDYMATHSSRVTSLCILAGRSMGLSDAEMAMLELAAQLHDIGKIGTPDEVLDKPGTLTDVEWVDILRHPDVGSSILCHIPALAHIASVVRHHHERFDGSGYPDGLRGEAIPLIARLIAVADAYEAMTTDRPYRRARTHEEAVAELRANAGSQFDPDILENFVIGVETSGAEIKAA